MGGKIWRKGGRKVAQDSSHPNSPHPPRAIYTSRVDDKGRLKLPKDFEAFLRTFPEQQFFVTTLDADIVRIYPIATWRENERFFEEHQEDPEIVEDLAFSVKVWGAEATLDKEGRILVPPELRRKLNIENQPVWVGFYKGAVEVYNDTIYNERMQRAALGLKQKLAVLRQKGLK